MTATPKQPEHRPEEDFLPANELICRQGVQPIVSANDLVTDDPFASDDDYADFLVDLRASRQSSIS